jgi:hypothetical protein
MALGSVTVIVDSSLKGASDITSAAKGGKSKSKGGGGGGGGGKAQILQQVLGMLGGAMQ